MARICLIGVVMMTLGLVGCTVRRATVRLIEPSYSHMRDPLASGAGSTPVNVTAGAEATALVEVE